MSDPRCCCWCVVLAIESNASTDELLPSRLKFDKTGNVSINARRLAGDFGGPEELFGDWRCICCCKRSFDSLSVTAKPSMMNRSIHDAFRLNGHHPSAHPRCPPELVVTSTTCGLARKMSPGMLSRCASGSSSELRKIVGTATLSRR